MSTQTVGVLSILLLAVVNAEVGPLTSANTAFGRTIMGEVGKMYDNVVFSAYSLHSALTMAAMGAKGNTQMEMTTVLGISAMQANTINDAYMTLISSYDNTGDVDLYTGNAIFQNPKFDIKQEYKDLVMNKYHATAQLLNFTNQGQAEMIVNDYVEEKTNGMIKDLFSPNSMDKDTTKLVLINTIFFNGTWARTFDKTDTKDMDFHVSSDQKKTVKMMTQQGSFHMKFTDDYKVLRLPFTQSRFALYIVVPEDMRDIHNPSCLSAATQNGYFTGLNDTLADIFVPKFEINFKRSLNDLLKKLGMRLAFTVNADFSNISPSSAISEVVHQAVIQVTETGTTAAAATGIQISLTSVLIPQNVTEFRVDRPFFFFLRDDTHEEILFQGKFSTPMPTPSAFVQEITRSVPQCDGGSGSAAVYPTFMAFVLCIFYSMFHQKIQRMLN